MLAPNGLDVEIVISDGLSAEAVHHNAPALVPALLETLSRLNISVGTPMLAPNGRVKLAEAIGEALKPKAVIMLIGERPGGDCASSRSLSAYLAYRVCNETEVANAPQSNHASRYEYTVLSNIYDKGTPPSQAALLVAERIQEILLNRAAGNRLEKILQDTKTD